MKHPSQRLKTGPRPFWKGILERYKFRSGWLRARVPLVLFRFRSPMDSREARAALRPQITQYPLALHLQFSWPQLVNHVSGPRVTVAKSTFSHSVIRELKHVLANPLRDKRSAAHLVTTLTRSAKAEPNPEWIGGEPQRILRSALSAESGDSAAAFATGVPRAMARNTLASAFRDQSSSMPETLRLFTERLLKNRHYNVFTERNSFATPLAEMGGSAHAGRRIFASGKSPVAFEAAAAVRQGILGRTATRGLRRSAELMPRASASATSRFFHPAPTDGEALQRARVHLGSRLFEQSAWLNLANQPAQESAGRAQSPEQSAPATPPARVQPLQPPLDISRLSDEVYRHIQRKIRVERERRGM
jgi:hypothetical protein